MVETITPHDLLPMDMFSAQEPITIDLVYADKDHPENIFSTALYHQDARLILHQDLARTVIAAARILFDAHEYSLVLKDGLRTVEAQHAMMKTKIVQDNPHWLIDPSRLLSSPGLGAHPRGMAIDVSLQTQSGEIVDMGTVFDTMNNESAREYDGFDQGVLDNRKILETAFVNAAERCALPMLPLPSEWWDFRFPRSYYERWAPLSDNDLPAPLRMVSAAEQHEDWAMHFDKAKKEVLNSL